MTTLRFSPMHMPVMARSIPKVMAVLRPDLLLFQYRLEMSRLPFPKNLRNHGTPAVMALDAGSLS